MVTRRGDHFYMVVNGATKAGDIAHLEARLPRTVVARPYEGAGPARAAGAEGGRRAGAARARASRQLGFMTGGAFEIGGASAWISRSGYTGEDGFEISVPAARRRGGRRRCSPTSPR